MLKCNISFAEVLGFDTNPITKAEFDSILKKKLNYPQPTLNEIDNFNRVLELFPKKLIISGDKLEIEDENNKLLTKVDLMFSGFIAYYPDENVLYFESGHNSDLVISMDNGTEIYETPKNRIYSPNRDYRYSWFYNGQAPEAFIQIKINGSWKELSDLSDVQDSSYFFLIRQFHWITNNKFIFINYRGTHYLGSIVHE